MKMKRLLGMILLFSLLLVVAANHQPVLGHVKASAAPAVAAVEGSNPTIITGLALDGGNDHALLPQGFPGVSDFTFVAWIYWHGGASWQRIFDFGQDTSRYMFLTPTSGEDTLRFAITTSGVVGEQRLNYSAPLPADGWHHVAVSLKGDNGKLYLDGSEVASGPITLDPIQVAGEHSWLGRSQYVADPYFHGELDEIAIFGRALNEDEIRKAMDTGWAGLTGMVLGLPMDEASTPHGTSLTDVSGSGNHGTLYRAALELAYTNTFELVWWDIGSGGDLNGSYWRPTNLPAGYYALGHNAQAGYQPTGGMFLARELEPGVLAPPVDYTFVWRDEGSGADLNGSFWKPVPPPGYICLGVVSQREWFKPDLNQIRCVRQDLVVAGRATDMSWWDKNTSSKANFSSWHIVPKDENGPGIYVGAFTAHADWAVPDDAGLFVLDSRMVQRFAPAAALELVYVDDFELVWDDKGSGGTYDGSYWRPILPDGYYALGHYGQRGYDLTRGYTFAARAVEPGALAAPVDYTLVWEDVGSGASLSGSFWKPVSPPGYVCLGLVVQREWVKPGLDEIRCVRQELAAPGNAGDMIWIDQETGSDLDFGSWYVVPDEHQAIDIGSFTARNSRWEPGAEIVFALDRRSVSYADDPLTSPEVDALIQQYGPLLNLCHNEMFFLDDAQSVLDTAAELNWALVENEADYDAFIMEAPGAMPTTSQTLIDDVQYLLETVKPNPPYNDSVDFRYWLSNNSIDLKRGDPEQTRAKALVRILPWNTFFTDIQFWFFYPFNGPGRVELCASSWLCEKKQLDQVGRHYGDWEHVTMRFLNSTQELVSVFMSAHAGGHWFGTHNFDNNLQFEEGHPLVYAGKYSHAHYPTTGFHYYQRIYSLDYGVGTASADLYDETGTISVFDASSPDRYQVVAADTYATVEPDWLCFRGRWGRYEKLVDLIDFTPLGIQIPVYVYAEVGAGPSGPPVKVAWYLGDTEHVDNGWPKRMRAEHALCSLSAASQGTGVVGQPIKFEAAVVTGSNVRYTWDFGDGYVGRGATVHHSYSLPGTYEVTAIASNPVGQRLATTSVTVQYVIHMPVLIRE